MKSLGIPNTEVRKELASILWKLKKNWKEHMKEYYGNYRSNHSYLDFLSFCQRDTNISIPVKCSNGIDDEMLCVDGLLKSQILCFLDNLPNDVHFFIEKCNVSDDYHLSAYYYVNESDYAYKDRVQQFMQMTSGEETTLVIEDPKVKAYVEKLEKEIQALKGKQ